MGLLEVLKDWIFYENLATIIGALGTIVGFFSWLWERKNRQRVELEHKRRIWNEISKIRGLMADLEKDEDNKDFDFGRQQATGKLTFMYRDLLKEIVILEKSLSISKIAKWRKVGKLGSDWQEQMALLLLLTEEIDENSLKLLSEDFSEWDELPESHSLSAGPFDGKDNIDRKA